MNLINQKFGRLTVIDGPIKENGRIKWKCECECGNIKVIQQTHIRSGATQSCGCLQRQKASKVNTTHGLKGTPLYATWKNIRQRCNNPRNSNYKNYGARGIKVCDEWNDYKVFYNWCLNNGYSKGLEIDRRDNDSGYSPDNCRFVKTVVNNRNRRITVTVEGLPLATISENHSLKYCTVKSRYYEALKKGIKPTIDMLITRQS